MKTPDQAKQTISTKEFLNQKELYQQVLFPAGEREIVNVTIETVRDLIDPSFSETIFHGCYKYRDYPVPHYSTMDPRQYPRGYCHIICGRVYEILKEQPIIQSFQAKWWLFEHDYMIYRDRDNSDTMWFVNIIRIGHKILDPDMREFYPDKSHPSLQDQDGGTYHSINYTNFVDTAEKYWGSKIYSSIEILWPWLAQFFPFVDIDPSGMLAWFPIAHLNLMRASIKDQGKEIQEFLQSDCSGVSIPSSQIIEKFQEVFAFIQAHNGDDSGKINQEFLKLFQKFIDKRWDVVGKYSLQDVLKNGWDNQTMTPEDMDRFFHYLLAYVHDQFFPIIIKTYNKLLKYK